MLYLRTYVGVYTSMYLKSKDATRERHGGRFASGNEVNTGGSYSSLFPFYTSVTYVGIRLALKVPRSAKMKKAL